MNLKVPVELRYGIRGKYYFYSIDTKFKFPILNIFPASQTCNHGSMAAAMRFSVVQMLVAKCEFCHLHRKYDLQSFDFDRYIETGFSPEVLPCSISVTALYSLSISYSTSEVDVMLDEFLYVLKVRPPSFDQQTHRRRVR